MLEHFWKIAFKCSYPIYLILLGKNNRAFTFSISYQNTSIMGNVTGKDDAK